MTNDSYSAPDLKIHKTLDIYLEEAKYVLLTWQLIAFQTCNKCCKCLNIGQLSNFDICFLQHTCTPKVLVKKDESMKSKVWFSLWSNDLTANINYIHYAPVYYSHGIYKMVAWFMIENIAHQLKWHLIKQNKQAWDSYDSFHILYDFCWGII